MPKNKVMMNIIKPKRVKILLATPVYSNIENDTFKSIFQMDIPKNVDVEFNYCAGYTVGIARTSIANYALENKFDYILWIDSDIIAPKNLLTKLYKIITTKKDCGLATGYYVKKIIGEPISELFIENQANSCNNIYEKDLPKNKVFEVKACGMGCCLTSCEDLKKIKDKYSLPFEYVFNKDNLLSEDINYCVKLQQEGKKIYADTSLRCGHIGKAVF